MVGRRKRNGAGGRKGEEGERGRGGGGQLHEICSTLQGSP